MDVCRELASGTRPAGWLSVRALTGGCATGVTGRSRRCWRGLRGRFERVVDFMREGPRGAEVTDVKVSNEEEPEGLSGFDVR